MLAELERVLCLKGNVTDLPGVCNVQVAGCRFLEEGACTCRAGLIHGIVDRHLVLKEHILRILTAYLEYGVHIVGEIGGSLSVSDNLVVDSRCLQEHSQNLAGRACGGSQCYADLAVADIGLHLLLDLLEAQLESLHRVAMGTAVVGCCDLVCLYVDKACFSCCGTAVHAQDVLSAGNCLTMLCREVCHL